LVLLLLLSVTGKEAAAGCQPAGDSVVYGNGYVKIVVHLSTGSVSYRFASGTAIENTVAYVNDLKEGLQVSAVFDKHLVTADAIRDPLGKGTCINVAHESAGRSVRLIQYITFYDDAPFVLVSVEGTGTSGAQVLETRDISPLSVLPAYEGAVLFPGKQGIITDYPFDNDSWVDVVARTWPTPEGSGVSGMSYELVSAYDPQAGGSFVAGSIMHDFWKTGLRYGSGLRANRLDSLIVSGGVSTRDNPALPDSYGGKDGTHDYMPHGTQSGASVYSPLVYLSATGDITRDLQQFGALNGKVNGYSAWKKPAPFYWNSFGVEDVLGYRKVMMPLDVAKISDYIASLPNFSQAGQPVISIDSYDGDLYSTSVLQSIGRYTRKKGQQLGFYFIPFSLWTWKNGINDAKLNGTDHPLRDVILRDDNGNYIPYKDGDFGAFPIDPTHPYTRDFIINQIKKAKEIDARFIKIDFLTAGALEAAHHYDPNVRTGIQAYNYGMKMLRHLVDSIMGPDIFIWQAISPLFPSQYTHTRFLSTDVYSHLRNSMPGYLHYGSTCASMISATNFWWTQGNLWPYTNMDVVVMKRFQKNKEISLQDVKVRLYCMLVMGSILGDGSDFRDKEAAERGRELLDNKAICALFSRPKAFTPLRFPVGTTQDQQVSLYLPGTDTLMVAAFNFRLDTAFTETFTRQKVGWQESKAYRLEELLSGRVVGHLRKGQQSFQLEVPVADATVVRLVPGE
ncbi:MAG: hypothetical protein JST39_06860, partial [Bacteroidetes bacterium]|nr:hypothetical protein [Bacteroidota bacterium]